MDGDITVTIKTMHRKKILYGLLKSIVKFIPDHPIIILDDGYISSIENIKLHFPSLTIDLIRTSPDIGANESRNIILAEVKTKYFLYLDDDYVFNSDHNLQSGLKLMEDFNLDILGGRLYDVFKLNSFYSLLTLFRKPKKAFDLIYNRKFLSRSANKIEIQNGILSYSNILPSSKDKITLLNADHVNNFFLAKTSSIRRMGGWFPAELKTKQHNLFFIRAKKYDLKVAYTDVFYAEHIRYLPLIYVAFRLFRLKKMDRVLSNEFKKMGINEIEYNGFK